MDRLLRDCQPVNREAYKTDGAPLGQELDAGCLPSRHAAVGLCLWHAVSHAQTVRHGCR